jgi:hypothetical protein
MEKDKALMVVPADAKEMSTTTDEALGSIKHHQLGRSPRRTAGEARAALENI